MKLHYTTKDITYAQYEEINELIPRSGLTVQVINGHPCWCFMTDNNDDETALVNFFQSLCFQTLNIDAVLDLLDFKSKRSNKNENSIRN